MRYFKDEFQDGVIISESELKSEYDEKIRNHEILKEDYPTFGHYIYVCEHYACSIKEIKNRKS